MMGDCVIFCVDDSECAFLSDDFPGSRWWYQRQAVTSLCAYYALQSGDSRDYSHLTAQQSRAARRMCIVTAGSARLQHPPSPVKEHASALASLLSLRMAEGFQSQYPSALRLAALVAKRQTSAHIVAFIAGPCALRYTDVPGLASRLRGSRLDIVMLAPEAEVDSSTVQALQSLVDCLNGGASRPATMETCSDTSLNVSPSSGRQLCGIGCSAEESCSSLVSLEACSRGSCAGTATTSGWQEQETAEGLEQRASRLLFVQPPEEGMEVWQQLEPLMEMLEGREADPSRWASPPPGVPTATQTESPTTPLSNIHTANASQDGTGLASGRPASNNWQQQPWHRGRALLARRSGVLTPALCRNESLDVLHHLSSDGFSRPWLPSYANLPQRAAAALQQQQQAAPCRVQVLRLDVPQWQLLLEVPAGRMLGPSREPASPQMLDLRGSCGGDTSSEAHDAVPSTFAAQSSQPWGEPSPPRSRSVRVSPVTAAMPSSPFDVPVVCAKRDAKVSPAGHKSSLGPRSAARKMLSPGRGQQSGSGSSSRERAARAREAGRPVRLAADARRGRLTLAMSMDDRHKLKLLWMHEPTQQGQPSPATGQAGPGGSASYPSLWERPAPAAQQTPGFAHLGGAHAALPAAELAVTLDPQAVEFSAAQDGRVLVVQQRLFAHRSRQRSHNEGLVGLTPDGHQVERWFFWLQRPPPVATADVSAGAAEPAACSGASLEAGDASEVAARLQELVANPPHLGARNAFRRALQAAEERSCGDAFVSVKDSAHFGSSVNQHPFSFTGQADSPPPAALASGPTNSPGQDVQGKRSGEHSREVEGADSTQRQQSVSAQAEHLSDQASRQSCEDSSSCRSPGRGLQQGLMGGSASLVPPVNAHKDSAPEDSVLFELD